MKFLCGVAYATFAVLLFSCDQTESSCSRPTITGYSRPYGPSVSTYKLTWQLLPCDQVVFQFQIQLTRSCSTAQPVTIYTGSNKTFAEFVIADCAEDGCYIRVRAELSNSMYSSYSICVRINNNLIQTERYMQLFHQDICVSIRGICESLSLPEFFINGHLTQWPQSDNTQYNVTYSQSSRESSFCFINITENIMISEFCYQHHLASCSLCSADTGERYFLSYSNIFIIAPPEVSTNIGESTTGIISPSSAKIYPASINDQEAEISKPINDELASRIQTHSVTHTVTGEDQLLEPDITNKIVLLGATAIGAAGILVGMILILVIPIGLWYRKDKRNEMAVNRIYEEPSLPDCTYDEVSDIKMVPEATIKMVGNDSYVHVTLKTDLC